MPTDELDILEADDVLSEARVESVTVTIPLARARALLDRRDLHPDVADRLQTAIEREHPTDETMTKSVKRAIARWYRRPGDAA